MKTDRIHNSAAAHRSRGGQAMPEFLVGMMALLLAAIAILTIGLLVKADTDAFNEARDAAEDASMGSGFAESFSPVRDVEEGEDGRFFTVDDEAKAGSLAGLRGNLAGVAYDGTGLDTVTRPDGGSLRYDQALRSAATGGSDGEAFGFQRGKGSASVTLPGAVERLFGISSECTLRHEVWMPQTGGLD